MSFLNRLMATSPDPTDDRYYGSYAPLSIAGVPVDHDTALKVSAAWACDRLICEAIAMLPALVYERLGDGGRQRAENHPLYDVLHTRPNDQQTPFEFFDFMSHCALFRGNAFARIVPGKRGFADQLVPLHPDRVRMDRLTNGGTRYTYTNLENRSEILNDEDVLHLRGMSTDGWQGASVISYYARDSLGATLASEQYGARFWRNNAQPGGVLQTSQRLSDIAYGRLKDSWEDSHSGPNQHRPAILEEGLEWKDVGISNRDSQFLEVRAFQAEEVCRWFRVPPHMVGLTSKVTSWGSGIEELGLGFVVYTLMPWLVRWQQAITRDLILAPQKYFVEFLTDALLRGDLKGRYDAYEIGVTNGWLSVNDVRRRENENPIPGGDVYNVQGPATTTPPAEQMPDEPMPMEDEPDQSQMGAHYQQLLWEAAGRVVRKEIAAITRASRHMIWSGEQHDYWIATVKKFYSDHADFVSQTLSMPVAAAQRYVDEQVHELTEQGMSRMSDWETRRVADLVKLATEVSR